MALILKVLNTITSVSAPGTATKTSITPSANTPKGWLVKAITLLNNAQGLTITPIQVQITKGATSLFLVKNLSVATSEQYVIDLNGQEVTLNFNSGTPDKIEITATGATGKVLNVLVDGLERDQ